MSGKNSKSGKSSGSYSAAPTHHYAVSAITHEPEAVTERARIGMIREVPAPAPPVWEKEVIRNERRHAAWEDKDSGSYVRHNAGVKYDGKVYREYQNVKVHDAATGYTGKFYAEEKYERPAAAAATQQSHGGQYITGKEEDCGYYSDSDDGY